MLPERGVDLRGGPITSGEVRNAPGKVWETSGRNCGLLSRSTVRGVLGKSPGKFGELLANSRELQEALGSLTPSHRHAKIVSNETTPARCICTMVWRRIQKFPFPSFSPSFYSSEGMRAILKPAPNPGTHQTPVETLSEGPQTETA